MRWPWPRKWRNVFRRTPPPPQQLLLEPLTLGRLLAVRAALGVGELHECDPAAHDLEALTRFLDAALAEPPPEYPSEGAVRAWAAAALSAYAGVIARAQAQAAVARARVEEWAVKWLPEGPGDLPFEALIGALDAPAFAALHALPYADVVAHLGCAAVMDAYREQMREYARGN